MNRTHRRITLGLGIGAAAALSTAQLALTPVAAQADAPADAGRAPARAAATHTATAPDFAGKTLRISYDNGYKFELRFEGADTAHWKVLAGQDPAEGTVKVEHHEQSPGVHRLKWTEADGTTVEQVQNWNTDTVTALIEFEQDGTKQRLDLKGTFDVVC
ncbi:MoaF N-terminal domain-containing protein [Streptomyces sp. NPDC001678]|uniref:MoaF-related domain-containing protein n=1 Tax=Streptomyces sp. NPDC001678 TaxID=3364599 RepID=UPI003676FFD9